jgi:hypothetical protein
MTLRHSQKESRCLRLFAAGVRKGAPICIRPGYLCKYTRPLMSTAANESNRAACKGNLRGKLCLIYWRLTS